MMLLLDGCESICHSEFPAGPARSGRDEESIFKQDKQEYHIKSSWNQFKMH